MPDVRFTEAAESDLADALAWYDVKAPEIVTRFREALRAVVARIEQNPHQFPPAPYDTRRALLRRFPYLVIFRETPEACFVVALFHTSRHPRTWQARALS